MAYTPANDPWVNGEDGGTPISANNLNHMEDGIVQAHELAEAAQATADAALGTGDLFVRNDVADAKGDILVATSADVVSKLGVGTSNQALFVDSSTSTGLAWDDITGDRISGYPNDSAKFLRGDGAWEEPPGGLAPTHLAVNSWGECATVVSVVANQAYLTPIAGIVAETIITRLGFTVIVSAGNYDVGIYYSDDEATFTRVQSLGSTALPSAGTRIATISTATLTPVANRRWYYAFAGSSGSATLMHTNYPQPGSYYKTSSFPLPASLTSMTSSSGSTENFPVIVGMV